VHGALLALAIQHIDGQVVSRNSIWEISSDACIMYVCMYCLYAA
jgi:hypothetical protein